MALFCESGSAPVQAAEGYTRMLGVVNGSEHDVARKFVFQDVRLVRGAALAEKPGEHEYAVLIPGDGLVLGNRIISPYAAIVGGENTGLAGCSDVGRCDMAANCLRSDPRLKLKSSHKGIDSLCRFLIPVAQLE